MDFFLKNSRVYTIIQFHLAIANNCDRNKIICTIITNHDVHDDDLECWEYTQGVQENEQSVHDRSKKKTVAYLTISCNIVLKDQI